MGLSLIECYNNYLGAGNPKSKFWFIGLEPGGSFDDFIKQEIYNLDTFVEKSHNIDEIAGKYYSRLNNLICKLCLKNRIYIKDGKQYIKIKEDKDNETDIFITNVFPLNFPSEKTFLTKKVEYTSVFEDLEKIFNKEDYYDYLIQTKTNNVYKRRNLLLKNIDIPKNVFVIGFSSFEKFKSLFEISQIEKNDPDIEVKWVKGNTSIQVYSSHISGKEIRIFNLPHLSRWSNFNDAITNNVVEELKLRIIK